MILSKNYFWRRTINPYLIAGILIIAGLLQSTLAPFLRLRGVHPEWVVCVILAWSFLRPFNQALGLAFAGGLVLDSLSAAPFGVFTVSLLAMAALAHFWHNRLSAGAFALPVLLALPYSVLFTLGALIMLWIFGYAVHWSAALGRIAFLVGLVNVPVMALVFPLLRRLNRFSDEAALTI
ncbi:MAG: rod shape-determining protein MreD [Anaerolineae bacterium]